MVGSFLMDAYLHGCNRWEFISPPPLFGCSLRCMNRAHCVDTIASNLDHLSHGHTDSIR